MRLIGVGFDNFIGQFFTKINFIFWFYTLFGTFMPKIKISSYFFSKPLKLRYFKSGDLTGCGVIKDNLFSTFLVTGTQLNNLLSCQKVYRQDTIQFNFLSNYACNICKLWLLLCVTFLGINFSFHAPWYAFIKQLKVWWRDVLPHLESNSFQPR